MCIHLDIWTEQTVRLMELVQYRTVHAWHADVR